MLPSRWWLVASPSATRFHRQGILPREAPRGPLCQPLAGLEGFDPQMPTTVSLPIRLAAVRSSLEMEPAPLHRMGELLLGALTQGPPASRARAPSKASYPGCGRHVLVLLLPRSMIAGPAIPLIRGDDLRYGHRWVARSASTCVLDWTLTARVANPPQYRGPGCRTRPHAIFERDSHTSVWPH